MCMSVCERQTDRKTDRCVCDRKTEETERERKPETDQLNCDVIYAH